MIEDFTVFTEGGMVVWSKQFGISSKGNPVNQLIGNVLLESRAGEDTYEHESMTMKWTRDNQLQLVFVCMYQKVLQLLYVEELLAKAKKKFVAMYKDTLGGKAYEFGTSFDFEKVLLGIINKCETEKMDSKNVDKAPRSFEDSDKWKQTKAGQNQIMHGIKTEVREGKGGDGRRAKNRRARNGEDGSGSDDDDYERPLEPEVEGEGEGDAIAARIAAMNARRRGKGKPKSGEGKSPRDGTPPSSPGKSPGKTKSAKVMRQWDDGKAPKSKADRDALDCSVKVSEEDMLRAKDKHTAATFGVKGKVELDGDFFNEESSSDEEEEDPKKQAKGMFSMFSNLVKGKVMDADDLEPVLRGVKESLVEKNVAVDIADKLCDSVAASLEGKRMDSWVGVKGTVKTALEDSLTRILTPKQSLDIVREIHHVRQHESRPYVIVFCGVNGVGKSTSLAKVCNWLLGNDMKVLIAACDTFRAGAVEQLKVHSRALGVDVYDQGYGKDAAGIAAEAVRHAAKHGQDVVLVDTAGRMQDNEPLMRALAKLVALNRPDLALFVGEALVGNDSVDQLKKFNQALCDHALNGVQGAKVRKQYIDGIFLTKFDTVDDKIGAALSMVYETGQPIVFVGVGQTYKDIRRMNVASIVKTLCK